jgi:hypothetical protein
VIASAGFCSEPLVSTDFCTVLPGVNQEGKEGERKKERKKEREVL